MKRNKLKIVFNYNICKIEEKTIIYYFLSASTNIYQAFNSVKSKTHYALKQIGFELDFFHSHLVKIVMQNTLKLIPGTSTKRFRLRVSVLQRINVYR